MTVLSQARLFLRSSILEIIPNVFQLSIRGTNIIVIAEEELTLVDAGFRGNSRWVIDFIHRLGRSEAEVSLIILTHNHYDHAGGVAELKRLTPARVAIHQADISDAESHPSYPQMIQRTLRIPPFSALHSVFSLKLSEIDLPLMGGEIFKPLGGLEVIHTPGHTPGSISLLSRRDHLLIVSDALNRRRWLPPKMASTDQRQALDSIRKMAQLDFDLLCYGHGRPLSKDARTRMQTFLSQIKN
jgi:glyoxylase-like metal-dependent hydrolase (beta-lactamase superfamily II)